MISDRKIHPYHPDVSIFLFAIPFISAINYYLTYHNIKLNSFLVLTFTIDTLQGYAAWWSVRYFILFLDKRWGYSRNRIILQFIVTTVIGLTVISILTELVSLIARGKTVPLDFYTVDLVIISIWFFVINGVYIGLYFFNHAKILEAERNRQEQLQRDGLLVRQGKAEVKLSFPDIAGFYVDNEYVIASASGKKFLLDQSLDTLEKNVPSDFFRLNRQCLVHRRVVSGFKRIENGKLLVTLAGPDFLPTEVTVSRIKASQFKDWFAVTQVISSDR
jgi:DNA-binding LytR/AlgR family response regulator